MCIEKILWYGGYWLTGFLHAEQSVLVPRVQGGGGSTQVPAFPGAEVWQICGPGHYTESADTIA